MLRVRFTLVWFSIGAHWLRRFSEVDLESLRAVLPSTVVEHLIQASSGHH
jgi:hypothetical protein